jgi:glutamate-1-semialdehyde 2,1-aminomutase
MSRSDREFQRAERVLVGGVNSPVRAFKSVGGTPRVMQRAAGCTLVDVDGVRYIDYIGSWGAAIVGHAHPAVVEAVTRAARDGLSFGVNSPLEVALAEEIIARVPSVERVRMVNSGTEAVMSAVRLARAATGRRKIVKFEGCYHGHSDGLLAKAGSGLATLAIPDSAGVTAGAAEDTLIARYNDLASVESLVTRHRGEIAAILVEPIAGNMGLVRPFDGFLQALRAYADDIGAVLIFDEVMTGFRVARGGAQALIGVRPDLTTFGKVIGGGLPVGAYGGRREIMALLAPEGDVYQAGTFSGNPATMAAGLATLALLDDDAYARLDAASARLAQGIEDALQAARRVGSVQRVGSMLTLFLDVARFDGTHPLPRVAAHAFADFFHAMLADGVHLPPSAHESWFVSLAHDDAAIDATISACARRLVPAGIVRTKPTHAALELDAATDLHHDSLHRNG